jgi:predicted nucleic acid-binding protein
VIVLDTNVISELLRPEPSAQVERWIDSRALLFTTSISVQESYFGLELFPAGQRRALLLDRLDTVMDHVFGDRILGYAEIAARHTAAVLALRQRAGHVMSTADAQIAGICLEHNATLATRNTRDFAGLPLDVVDPWRG